jgi:hypothetical protein
MVFQDKTPYCTLAHLAAAHKSVLRPSTDWLKAMSASLVSRLTYAAANRLNGIGQCAIGDMDLLRLRRVLGCGTLQRHVSRHPHYRRTPRLVQV